MTAAWGELGAEWADVSLSRHRWERIWWRSRDISEGLSVWVVLPYGTLAIDKILRIFLDRPCKPCNSSGMVDVGTVPTTPLLSHRFGQHTLHTSRRLFLRSRSKAQPPPPPSGPLAPLAWWGGRSRRGGGWAWLSPGRRTGACSWGGCPGRRSRWPSWSRGSPPAGRWWRGWTLTAACDGTDGELSDRFKAKIRKKSERREEEWRRDQPWERSGGGAELRPNPRC